MNHRAPSGSLGEVWEEREAQAVQGSPSDALWETAIHLPDVTTPSTSATKLKTIAVLGHEKVTCISLGAALSAKKRKSCADSNVTWQSWVTGNRALVILQTQKGGERSCTGDTQTFWSLLSTKGRLHTRPMTFRNQKEKEM